MEELLRTDAGAATERTLGESTAVPAGVWTTGGRGGVPGPRGKHRVPQAGDAGHGEQEGCDPAGTHGHGAAEDAGVDAQLRDGPH